LQVTVGGCGFINVDGRTDRGRQLCLVFQDKGNGLARVFTGWDLKRKRGGKDEKTI